MFLGLTQVSIVSKLVAESVVLDHGEPQGRLIERLGTTAVPD